MIGAPTMATLRHLASFSALVCQVFLQKGSSSQLPGVAVLRRESGFAVKFIKR